MFKFYLSIYITVLQVPIDAQLCTISKTLSNLYEKLVNSIMNFQYSTL